RRHTRSKRDWSSDVCSSDLSGTSYNFTDYLSKVSPAWKQQVGRGTAVDWATGIGGKGNEGVSAYVRQFKNAIGYVEYAYAIENRSEERRVGKERRRGGGQRP